MVGKVARVVLQGAAMAFDKPYTYAVPVEMLEKNLPGCRVLVPFGRGNRKRQGMILSVGEDSLKGLKSVFSLIDKSPVLNEEMIGLCEVLKETTFCTYYDAIHTLLPTGLTFRLVNYYSANEEFADVSLLSDTEREIYLSLSHTGEKSEADITKSFGIEPAVLNSMTEKQALNKNSDAKRRMNDATQKWVRIADGCDLSARKLTPRQTEVTSLLERIGSACVKEICYYTGVSAGVIQTLIKNGVLTSFEKEVYRTSYQAAPAERREIVLTDEQQKAYEGLLAEYRDEKPHTSLLYGVTGSGKTQVFLKLVDAAVQDGSGVIVMVPEIALTPQLLQLFSSRYGNRIAVFHSAMSIGKRLDEWKRIRDGKAQIAIGTRSAVFAPLPNPRLIIMDEEQEHTYKSEQSPRFHARDVARTRMQKTGGLVLLASATPSIESFTMAKTGKYSLYTLQNRYGNAVLPVVETVDTRQEIRAGNTGALSRRLHESLTETLENGHQAILLLNRRGHNTFISCPDCGATATCPNCSISLTYHSANRRMMCHYCGYSVPVTQKCPQCGAEHLKYMGLGTQKAEEELHALFPDAKILRLDADSTASRDSYATFLHDFAEGKYDILLGTQMVAKGLDFPNVTLVGVLGADNAAFSEDYRSFERTFSLLTQVVGRAGRGNDAGLAFIQTANPDSNIISLARAQDYIGFYEQEIMTRKLMVYPPYCDICLVWTRSHLRDLAEDAIRTVFDAIKGLLDGEYKDVKLIILGPAPASVVKVNNRYRYRMMIKCKNNARFRQMLRKAVDIPCKQDTIITVDMNPENIL